jgi:hypothetical protein
MIPTQKYLAASPCKIPLMTQQVNMNELYSRITRYQAASNPHSLTDQNLIDE